MEDSERAGLRFVRALVDEWANGSNRFHRPREAFFAAWLNDALGGICGLNIDPYTTTPAVGRVRHLYVLSTSRGRGVGAELMRTTIAQARETFTTLRLSTSNPTAARLYERCGFRATTREPKCTHLLPLTLVS